MTITTINPATEKIISHYHYMPTEEIEQKIDQSHEAYLLWKKKSLLERTNYFLTISNILLENKEKYAALITEEMGKPIRSATEEIKKCALACRHFAENAKQYLAPRIISTEMSKSYVTYNPLGIVFSIMPWNFPFWQVFRFAAPALIAGNTILLKHAPNTTACGLEIENIFKLADFPKNVFQTLIIANETAEKLIANPKIAAITLTGSNRTGKIVGSQAGNALKKIVLELGGSDPYIILEDADLKMAAEAVVTSRMNNTGQSCIAAKRILAVKPIREQFEKYILDNLQKYQLGDPTHPNANIGPLARKDLHDNLVRQVDESLAKGAKILYSGNIPSQVGFYYPPTVLVNVKKGMPAFEEELFGPVITFIDVKDEEEAIAIANETSYGLSAAIFTKNIPKGEQIAINEINAGTVFVNDFVRSDPRLPFGGIKNSGFGRELSCEGIHEFVNVKTIGIK